MEFTEDEKKLLMENGYTSVGENIAYAYKKPDLIKRRDDWFLVGVEGIDKDVDGDSGWARQWITFDTLPEAIKFALSNPVYKPNRY